MCQLYKSALKEAERRGIDTSALGRDCMYAAACTQNGLECIWVEAPQLPPSNRIQTFERRTAITQAMVLQGLTTWLAHRQIQVQA
ncbi:hypothetical protein HYS82_03090 [Candidatus Amesbacteria bacterium]|nr:hypothetical protein [Candidatus Amesbacteria bacterium]MBI2587447.1 hypothetical protein [Candidatus Amesbacteria bacterium]